MKKDIIDYIDKHSRLMEEANNTIWDLAELPFEEYKSSEFYMDILEKEGFTITKNLAAMPTAFKASFGSGDPKIAILAEYDALPGLSQEAQVSYPSPLIQDGSGHGCGHNSLGAGSLGAVLAIRDYILDEDIPGTIEFYGCPAEENGNGKTFMARDGIFDHLDIALTWHPMAINEAWSFASLANISTSFNFKGVSSHAAASPHLGRSALDAAEIMNIGVNYLREHIIPEARVHYAYLDVGGTAPNVVQSSSSLHYFIRAPKLSQVKEIRKRIQDIAKGAALISGTSVEEKFFTGLSDFIPNPSLTRLVHESLEEVGLPDYDEEDLDLAREFFNTLSDGEKEDIYKKYENREDVDKHPIHGSIEPLVMSDRVLPGSTDLGDVSYVVPTAQFTLASMALGTPLHSWQATAQTKSNLALKAVSTAAATMALTAIKVLNNPEIASQARRELNQETGGIYDSPLADHVKPNINKLD